MCVTIAAAGRMGEHKYSPRSSESERSQPPCTRPACSARSTSARTRCWRASQSAAVWPSTQPGDGFGSCARSASAGTSRRLKSAGRRSRTVSAYSGKRRCRSSTENIGIARHREGLDLIRIGKPPRGEFAAWRYGDQFRRRYRLAALGGVGSLGFGFAIIALPIAFPTSLAMAGAWAWIAWSRLRPLAKVRVGAGGSDGGPVTPEDVRRLQAPRTAFDAAAARRGMNWDSWSR